MFTRDRVLIVDGYNVLRSGSRYAPVQAEGQGDYTDDAFNHARQQLINDVCCFAGKDYDASIVFDGGRNSFSTGDTEMVGGVKIIFSRAGVSADKVIEKLAHEAKSRNRETLVVSSDASIQNTVFGSWVDRMSAEGFCREMNNYYHDIELDDSPKIAVKNTVAGRIDSTTLEKLRALRDSL